jgi:signal transduction histidine kinase
MGNGHSRGMIRMNAAPPIDPKLENEILKRLLDVSLVLNSNFDLEILLNYIMEIAAEITHSEAASILLLDPRTNELFFIATSNQDTTGIKRVLVPLNDSIAGEVVLNNLPIVIQDATNDTRINRKVDKEIAFVTRSLMGVPMRIRDEVIGVIEVVNRLGPEWTKQEQDFLQILASQAAVAINNAEQAENLRKANDRLNELDKLKNDFIAIASHELRTPLSVIVGYASFLQEETHGETSEHAEKVLESAQHLTDLIEDMTNLRYLQMGAAELSLERETLVSLLQTAQREAEALAGAKEQYLEVHYPGLSDVVMVDKVRLNMALTNILNNAVKFTPRGGRIELFTERKGGEIWIKIQDTGIGIPPDQIERIFENFYQVQDHMTRHFNGMGLGLSISKAVIEAHEGRIWAESKGANSGTTITFSLPIAR